MKSKFIITMILPTLLFASACNGGTTSSSSSPTPSVVSDEFEIENLPFLYYGLEPEPLVIKNTNRANEITYQYDDTYIYIENNTVEVVQEPRVNPGLELTTIINVPVTATLGNVTKTFNVSVKKTYNRENKMTIYRNEIKTRSLTENKYTVFCGDSFFDVRYSGGWHNFYNDVGGDAWNCGIAGSNLEEWFYYAPNLLYPIKPKYISLHLGSNDFWDIKSNDDYTYEKMVAFIERVHRHLPDTKFIIFGTENRTYPIPGKNVNETITFLKNYNTWISEYCEGKDYIQFVDSLSHFADPQGIAYPNMFKDGVHPIDSEYEYYTKQTISHGANNITYIGEEY